MKLKIAILEGDGIGPEIMKQGVAVLDAIAEELGARYWKSECGAKVAHVRHNGEELLLAKPQSYMNTSGGPLSKIAAAHGIHPEELLVIHDDLDIEPGTIRVKLAGGHGGHNGLRSIHAKSRDNARTPMQWTGCGNAGFTTGTPWLRVNPNYPEINVRQQERDPDSVLHF